MKVLPHFRFWGIKGKMVESGSNEIVNPLKARNWGPGDRSKLACPLFSRYHTHAAAPSPHHQEQQWWDPDVPPLCQPGQFAASPELGLCRDPFPSSCLRRCCWGALGCRRLSGLSKSPAAEEAEVGPVLFLPNSSTFHTEPPKAVSFLLSAQFWFSEY